MPRLNFFRAVSLAKLFLLAACAIAPQPTADSRPPTIVVAPAPIQVASSTPMPATAAPLPRASATPTIFLPVVTATVTPVQGFAFSLGSAGIDYGKDLTIDRAGNTIVAGYFSQTVDFDPGSGVANLTSRGGVDNFIAQYDRAGNYRWAIGVGGAGLEIPHSVVTDKDDSIYIAGYFSASVDFDPGSGTATLTSAGGRDVYTAKYDTNGKYLWATGLGGVGDDEAFDLALDSAGNVYVTGIFTNTITLNGRNIASAGSTDIFVVSYDANGTYRWGFTIGGAGQDHGHAIRVGGNGKVYLAGLFAQTVDFDPSANTNALTSEGGWDAFFAQYDTNGNFQWAKRFGGRANDQVRPGAMAIDARGNVYLAGDFALTADFDLGSGVANLTSKGSGDIFIAKYDANANSIWAISVGGAGLDAAHRLTVDANENVYATGWFVGAVDFDPSAGTRTLNGAGLNGASDVFVAKYDQRGNLVWVNGFGAPVSGQDKFSLGGGIALDALGNVVIAGRFFGEVDVDPSAKTFSLKSAGESDCFVVKYDANGNLVTTVVASPTADQRPPTATVSPTMQRPNEPTTQQTLKVDFNDGKFDPLVRSFGPTDNPQQANPAYTVNVENGVAKFVAPQRSAGVAFTGMLDLPRNLTPIRGEMSFQWTFPNASELLKLGGEQANAWAIAADWGSRAVETAATKAQSRPASAGDCEGSLRALVAATYSRPLSLPQLVNAPDTRPPKLSAVWCNFWGLDKTEKSWYYIIKRF